MPDRSRGHDQNGGNHERTNRGFAAMDGDTQREIARKGGATVSRNRAHMADIGRRGGKAVSGNREHMAEIGRKGGEASGGSRTGSRSAEGSHEARPDNPDNRSH